ncbi:hypothetical protein R6Q59_033589 [Mikania micrantha]|uniref:Cyclin-dependent kinase inhibitor n=1 Tax=Mikania micrantha TaxID=192012 RepID=A0A5N6NUG2_9ASTR|nr:hypothetical protein E3N88_18282 [Mikania micrantha]
MIEETDTTGCEYPAEIPVTEASISLKTVRRSRDSDVTTSCAGKRRRFASRDQNNVFQFHNVNFRQNGVSTAVSATSDHVNSSVMCSVNDDSISDLKAKCHSETETFNSINGGFSRDSNTSSVICSETEEIESVSTSNPETKVKKEQASVAVDEATSRRKPPPPAAKMPSPAELEEFFCQAELYEQKRFIEKYNFDIVKDVPTEGRYQWVRLNC